MVEDVIYETLDFLAEKHIPEGMHKVLYVNSRETWMNLMLSLIDNRLIKTKVSMLTKCAINWELLLIEKISIQN